jgi:hypothetical protein
MQGLLRESALELQDHEISRQNASILPRNLLQEATACLEAQSPRIARRQSSAAPDDNNWGSGGA